MMGPSDKEQQGPLEPEDESLDQDDLDALLAAYSGTNAQEEGIDEPLEGDTLDQAALDALIAAQIGDATEESAAPDDADVIDQAELDALIASQTSSASGTDIPSDKEDRNQKGPEPVPDESETPAEVASGADVSESTNDVPDFLDQDELDKLFNEPSAKESPPKPAFSPATPTPETAQQDDVDDNALLDQDELDRLFASGNGEPVPTQAPKKQESSVTPQQSESSADQSLSQSELDALIAAQGKTPKEPEETGSETFSQSDLDELIASTQIDDELLGPSDDEVLGASGDTAFSDLLSQSELDSLVEQSGESIELSDNSDLSDQKVSVLTDDELDEALSEYSTGSTPPETDIPTPFTETPDEIDERLYQNGFQSEDDVLQNQPRGYGEPGLVDQSSIDDLIASAGDNDDIDQPDVEHVAVAESADMESGGDDLLSQDMLDALMQEADASQYGTDEPEEESTPLSYSRETDDDTLIEPLVDIDNAPYTPASDMEESAPAPKRSRFRKPLFADFTKLFSHLGSMKIAASLLAGLIAAAGAYYVTTSLSRRPSVHIDMVTPPADTLDSSIRTAQAQMDIGNYQTAISILDTAMEKAPVNHPRMGDAEFVKLESMYQSMPRQMTPVLVERMQAATDQVVVSYPLHDRVPEAIQWKADMLERAYRYHDAHNVYMDLANRFPETGETDRYLYKAAQMAMYIGVPEEATELLRRMLDGFPGSPLAGEARILFGDAYLAQGHPERARQEYLRIARTAPDTRQGAQAFARLGQLAIHEGRPADAVTLLRRRLDTLTTIQGNDEAYILLAQAYRALDDPAMAEETLRELVTFFPDTPMMPDAFTELADVLEELGKRQEALTLINQAAQRFPGNPTVLRRQARLLQAADRPLEAAEAMLAADAAGANEPQLLLDAAQILRMAGHPERAQEVFSQVLRQYPATSQAFDARLEEAQALYDQGRYREAHRRLTNLALMTQGSPEHLRVLTTQAQVYDNMGMQDLATETWQRIASLTTDPRLLAQTSIALLRYGHTIDGLEIARRLDPATLDNTLAYAFLSEYGKALLTSHPARGMELMEQARETYPSQRKRDYENLLFATYLSQEDRPRARAMVDALAAQAMTNAEAVAPFQEKVVAWGDYLYGKGDFAAAESAYGMIDLYEITSTPDAEWARFQRANALLQLERYADAVRVYDDIVETDSIWAGPSRLKAAYARLEQQLLGLSVSPPSLGK